MSIGVLPFRLLRQSSQCTHLDGLSGDQADGSDRRINTSPATIEDKDVLKKLLTTPPIKKIDLHFPLGLEVTARNLKGVTIKDACDAIHKQFKKKVCPRWSSFLLIEMC